MKRLLVIFFFLPVAVVAQVNLWVNQIPDTLYQDKEYTVRLNISTSSDFSSLMISIARPKGLEFINIHGQNAKVYYYANVINLVWDGYKKEKPKSVVVRFKVKKEDVLPGFFQLHFVASYLINGLKGEQLAVYKYVLRRKGNELLYVLENQ